MVSLANSQPANKPQKDNTDFKSLKFTLANSLQTSLDLHETLSSFYKILPKFVSCAGMSYSRNSKSVMYKFGNNARHSATYNLQTKEAKLGKVCFLRSKKFSEEELNTLETVIGILVYPLRNALLYREALENSLRDSLTQVGNRAAMELTLKRELKLSMRSGQPLSLLMLDIDHFKKINDTAGHHVGDKILRIVADRVTEALRQTDQVFRYGGEEFVILLSDTGHDAAILIAERIRLSIMNIKEHNNNELVPVTASIGVSSSAENDTRDKLITRGDKALYAAKAQGRNQVISETDLPATQNDNLKAG